MSDVELPCPTFSEAETDADACKHCGWTPEAHEPVATAALVSEVVSFLHENHYWTLDDAWKALKQRFPSMRSIDR